MLEPVPVAAAAGETVRPSRAERPCFCLRGFGLHLLRSCHRAQCRLKTVFEAPKLGREVLFSNFLSALSILQSLRVTSRRDSMYRKIR